MKRRILYFLIICMIMFTSCLKHEVDETYQQNMQQQINENVEKIFGVKFDSTHDWRTTVNTVITVIPNSSDNILKVQVYVSESQDSIYSLKLLNEVQVENNNSINISIDIPINYTDLFVAFINDKEEYVYKRFDINDKEVYYDDNARTRTRVLFDTYSLPNTALTVSSEVETFANHRGWLPGEVFYTFNNPQISGHDYSSDFKSIFRTIIFNYFPNGRSYNNLPQIKKSGYYNESVYPITTGGEPIILSPVYKNDGGYQEISQAELYYYYFKGNPSVAEIEALPKYQAINLSKIYSNSDNDNIRKGPAYALAYFGDGKPEIGTSGTFNFPSGYKIGFVYKSNTTYEKPKKQGEIYGDGRLNYNINNWGNFKSSGLGNTDPRMAWMSVNKHMFLCVESGTDKDFNDLIVEVEGGIEPIIIPPVDPEYNFYTFLFEDHNLGDYDMNDVVIKGRRINETKVEWTLMACGAYDDLYIHNINGNLINSNTEVHDILSGERGTYINTEGSITKAYVTNTVTVPKTYSFLDASTQPYIYDATINNTVKIAMVGQDPHAIMVSYDFKWPKEKISIKDAYNTIDHQFNSWGANKVDATDWYKYPNVLNVVR